MLGMLVLLFTFASVGCSALQDVEQLYTIADARTSVSNGHELLSGSDEASWSGQMTFFAFLFFSSRLSLLVLMLYSPRHAKRTTVLTIGECSLTITPVKACCGRRTRHRFDCGT